MCDDPSTSKEHVPPRCLFPESKDVGSEHRKNLITVPSCDKHNSHKSSDDEFLMVSLAGIIGNNSIGYRHKFTKVNRAIYRSSFALLKRAMKDQKWHVLEVAPNKFIDVVWGTPDHTRLYDCFDRISRGLFLDSFARKFSGRTKTMLAYLPPDASNPKEFKRFIRDKLKIEIAGKARLGSNPDVFFYQFSGPDQFGLYLVHLLFYGGLDVFVAMIPDESQMPYNLGMDLINRGIRTTLTLGDAEYQFNVD
jgi:hypothetical protein